MSTFITKLAKEKYLKKIDASSNMTIAVSKADIQLAKMKNSKCCAFARACKRQVNGIKGAYFFRSVAWLEYDDKLVRYVLLPSVRQEIVAFDRSKSAEPGIYTISKPAKSQKMSNVKKRSAKRPGRHKPGNGNINRKIVHRVTNVRNLFEPKNAQ